MHDGIEGFHRIAIIGELDGKGTLFLDPNKCTVNEFGDPVTCTVVAIAIVNVTIKDTKKSDPSGLGRKLYWLEGAGLQNPLFLVVSPDTDRPVRLIYNHRGEKAPVPITLEPLVYTGKRATRNARVEPCRGKYYAQQVPGAVIVFGAGAHPTSGYQVFFEELPIDVFPPQFRLMHIKPGGPAAQAITPFAVYTRFKATEKVEQVIVHDANGCHKVPVEQVPDEK